MLRCVRRVLSAICCVALIMAMTIITSPVPATAASGPLEPVHDVPASPAVNVNYVHGAINSYWGIDIPPNAAISDTKNAVNMKYLLGMVDIANARLGTTTSYGTGEYATSGAVSQNTANNAIKTLIRRSYPFTITTTSTNSFSFNISASGLFYIDWGDGTEMQQIVKTDTNTQTISHTYTSTAAHTIKMGGRATGYSAAAAISFAQNTTLAKISGSLGRIFVTQSDGTQPSFSSAFMGCTNLSGSIPAELFAGISGAPRTSMFEDTFNGCVGLTGAIPAGLFSGITGAPATLMFKHTFYGCTGLTSIPSGLFAGISGTPQSSMFNGTFYGCTGLRGAVPSGLFSGVTGAPAYAMFHETFYGCTGLTSIPANLFAGVSGAPAGLMFKNTFYGCSHLTSIPSGLFAGIKGAPASSMFNSTFANCTGLTSIPSGLFAGVKGAPASAMYYSTFSGCTKLSGQIPVGVFGTLSGSPASLMFKQTFSGCSGLTGPSARNPNGTYLYNVFSSATASHVGSMYYGVKSLSDYSSIPSAWK